MIKSTMVVASASMQPLPRTVQLNGVDVIATVPTLVLELVDPETNEHVYRRIPAPGDEIIAAFPEGAEVELTVEPKE